MYIPKPQLTDWQLSESVDLSLTAVIVVDILGGSDGIMDSLQEMADNAVAIVEAARDAGIPVFFTDDEHLPEVDLELTLWGEHGMKGTEGCKPLDIFDVQPTDRIIPKRRYNAFFGTDLDISLRELGVDTLIVFGYDTNICVMHTLAGAYFLGYKTIVPADATASFLVGNQEDGLEYFSRCFDSRVVDTETVLEYLDAD